VIAMAISAAVWRFTVPPLPAGPVPEPAFIPPPHSVAIMAFANLTGEPAQAYFSDGLSEELTDSLGRIAALRVAARQSSFAFKDKPATIAQIARALNVGAVLEGSVRRDHATLRISAQLIDAATGYQLWSHQYDHAEDDILKVQGDIAQAITAALQVALAGDDLANLTRGGSANAGAFDAYLRGMQLIRSLDRSAFPDALVALDKAVAIDPAFALAHSFRAVALVDIAYDMGDANPAPRRRMLEQALVAADRAIALEPRLAEGYAARAIILNYGLLNPDGAVADARTAATLAPNNLQTQCALADTLIDAGRINEAVEAGQRATELDPFTPDSWEILGYVLYSAHRPDAALAALDHVKALAGRVPPMAAGVLAYTEMMKGDANAASRICPGIGASPRQAMCLAIADHALGRNDDARVAFDAVRAAPSYTYYDGAVIYAQWGKTEDALAALEAAYGARDPKLGQINTDPLLDPLRALPAFHTIAQRVAQARPADGN
jgi:TolB-like protein